MNATKIGGWFEKNWIRKYYKTRSIVVLPDQDYELIKILLINNQTRDLKGKETD